MPFVTVFQSIFDRLPERERERWWGRSGGARLLGKFPVSGHPADLVNSKTWADCTCSRCGWGLFGHFFSNLLFISPFSISGRRPDTD